MKKHKERKRDRLLLVLIVKVAVAVTVNVVTPDSALSRATVGALWASAQVRPNRLSGGGVIIPVPRRS